MKIAVYYGGRGVIEDTTIYVVNKLVDVLNELNVQVKRYNLYEQKNEIAALSGTIKEFDGVILAVPLEWYGIGGYMQHFLDACWLYADKEKLREMYMMPVVVAVTCGEGFDTHSLELPGRQQLLLEALHATGKPVVLVMESGRPYAIRWAKENIPAILQAWYPGEQGGYALAETLFGDYNPSGRLPITFPRSAGHIPSFYNHKVTARGYYKVRGSRDNPGRDYVFETPDPLFGFGEGLSYTTFAYSDLQVPETAIIGQPVQVSVTVENTGDRAGAEVVQLYVTDCVCRIAPFVRQLKGFEKIFLEPGEKKTVTFTLGYEDFSFINEQMEPEVEPGAFILRVGPQQAQLQMLEQ